MYFCIFYIFYSAGSMCSVDIVLLANHIQVVSQETAHANISQELVSKILMF